jgi:hypothetical protein
MKYATILLGLALVVVSWPARAQWLPFGLDSFFLQVMTVEMQDIHRLPDAPPPPAKYDRPYPNVEIIMSRDMDYWEESNLTAVTKPPQTPGGKCYIYHRPMNEPTRARNGKLYVLEQVSFPALIRHEMGHCWGLIHLSSERTKEMHHDLWSPGPVKSSFGRNDPLPAF